MDWIPLAVIALELAVLATLLFEGQLGWRRVLAVLAGASLFAALVAVILLLRGSGA